MNLDMASMNGGGAWGSSLYLVKIILKSSFEHSVIMLKLMQATSFPHLTVSICVHPNEMHLLISCGIILFYQPSNIVLIQIWVPSNPKGAERLPPGIVESESDFYLRRLWGKPSEVSTHHNFSLQHTALFNFLVSAATYLNCY